MSKKYKVIIDEKEVEVEIDDEAILSAFTQDEIIENVDFKDKSKLATFLEKIGIKMSSKKEESDESSEEQTDNKENKLENAVLTELLSEIKEMRGEISTIKSKSEQTEKAQAEKKVNELISKAVSDGRIAKGEIEAWKTKYEEKFNGDIELFQEFLTVRPIDEKLKTDNAKSQQSSNQKTDSKEQEPSGVGTYTQEQLRDRKFYRENRKDIEKAASVDQIIKQD